jgi:hypothetical protein
VSDRTDPVLKHARREAIIIGLAWLASTTYCCVYCYAFGYRRPGRPLGVDDIQPILGLPSWFLWGVIAPWLVCAAFTGWFAGFFMADDDLGADHSQELESDIREGGLHE